MPENPTHMPPCHRLAGIAALHAFFAIAAGAFAAHALKTRLDAHAIEVFHTASYYQLTHALALLALGLWQPATALPGLKSITGLMQAGIVLFSGSLYLLALTGIKWLGMITPLGGLCFLAAWLWLAWMMLRRQ